MQDALAPAESRIAVSFERAPNQWLPSAKKPEHEELTILWFFDSAPPAEGFTPRLAEFHRALEQIGARLALSATFVPTVPGTDTYVDEPSKGSTSPLARSCPPRRSATSPPSAGSTVGESILLHGPVGVGKTHVAQALGHLAIRQGAEVRFYKTSRALADLAGGHADGTWTRRLRELARPAVLVLDDFAMRELTPAQADDLYELISERARPLPDPHLEPHPGRLVPAVPQPRRRRVPARPADQQQPPSLHERSQLPTQQTPRRAVVPQPRRRPANIKHGPDRGNYVIAARGNYLIAHSPQVVSNEATRMMKS